MKFIDVTLRDGGHQHGFNWPLEFIERYFRSINLFPEIEFVELGYWKQSGKFDGPFYSIEEQLLSSICEMTKKKLSIMVDYHYCSHNVEDFPTNSKFNDFCEFKKFAKFRTGKIGLQDHRDKVSFRNIKIRKL